MPRYTFIIVLFTLCSCLSAQSEECNKLGVWLWHIEDTGFSHRPLANNLSLRNINRVYAKVADGRIDSTRWPELVDKKLVSTYKEYDVEPWAWSYNYQNNYSRQAEALYYAAKTGYLGFVVDVEMEFDGEAAELDSIFSAFYAAKQRAIDDGHASEDFKLYVTTWGNPKDHNYSISSIDPYVDGYMPQTYVEYWGQSYVENITYWIEEGNREYAELGATKPIHHIASTATGVMTPEHIDEFILASGAETSLWRVPGGSVSQEVWQDWYKVDWEIDFCMDTDTYEIRDDVLGYVFPNPTSGIMNHTYGTEEIISFFDLVGNKVLETAGLSGRLNLDVLPPGIYYLKTWPSNFETRVIKL